MPILTLFATPRRAIMAVFAAFGTAIGAWAGAIPGVTRNAHIGDYDLGIGITLFTIVYVAAMALAGRLARGTGNRTALLVIIPQAGFATLLVFGDSAPSSSPLVLFGATLGNLDVFMNAETRHRTRSGRRIF
jgi:MFS family permease